jgi:hypothetical protein
MGAIDGWAPIRLPWYKKYFKWGWWKKRSYSVQYDDMGLTPGVRLRLTRSTNRKPTKFHSATYHIVTKVNGDGSLTIDDGKKKTIIALQSAPKKEKK